MMSFDASEKNVRLVGRYVIKDGVTWLVQSGSSAGFTVSGSCAEVILAGDSSINAESDFRPRYAVYADGRLIADKTMDKPRETVKLFSGDSTKVKVTVMMLSESEYGAVGIASVNVSSDGKAPVRPADKKSISIGFIGDSITCAYGVEGAGFDDPFRTSTENFTKSYAFLTAKSLNADYSTVCYSGYGIISGYTSTGVKDPNRVVPDLYDKASRLPGYSEKWDFEKHKDDIIVLNLGTNDSSFITADNRKYFDERMEEFTAGYVAFLKRIREKNRGAYIICTFGTMDNDDIYEYVGQAVRRYKSQSGDSRVEYFHTGRQNAADGYGCDWHPSEVTHRKLSVLLAERISSILVGV